MSDSTFGTVSKPKPAADSLRRRVPYLVRSAGRSQSESGESPRPARAQPALRLAPSKRSTGRWSIAPSPICRVPPYEVLFSVAEGKERPSRPAAEGAQRIAAPPRRQALVDSRRRRPDRAVRHALPVRDLRRRQLQPTRLRRGARRRRRRRAQLQPALPLRRRGPRQDAPAARAASTCAERPGFRVLYFSAEQFVNELINSIRFDRMPTFRERYRSIDVLLVDDVQFLANKERTQEEFFHTFNALYTSQKQIILSCDSSPQAHPDPAGTAAQPLRMGPDRRHRGARPGDQDRDPAPQGRGRGRPPSRRRRQLHRAAGASRTSASWKGCSTACRLLVAHRAPARHRADQGHPQGHPAGNARPLEGARHHQARGAASTD